MSATVPSFDRGDVAGPVAEPSTVPPGPAEQPSTPNAVASIDVSTPAALPDVDGSAPDGPEEQQTESGRGRAVVLVLLATLLGLALLVVFLLPVAAGQRQGHLRGEYRKPASQVPQGGAAYLLQIPAIGMDQVVARGAEPNELRGGPGWREGSAPAGQGNTVLLGRSTLWSYPFGQIDQLKGGNLIYLRTRDDRVYVYKVTTVRTVGGDDTKVMQADGPTRLTLVTSAGGPFDSSRVVVQAVAAGTQPEVPEDQRAKVSSTRQVGSFDERPLGDALLLVAGFAVAGTSVLATRELRRRYSTTAVVVVAGPALVLGVALILFNLDAFLPITY